MPYINTDLQFPKTNYSVHGSGKDTSISTNIDTTASEDIMNPFGTSAVATLITGGKSIDQKPKEIPAVKLPVTHNVMGKLNELTQYQATATAGKSVTDKLSDLEAYQGAEDVLNKLENKKPKDDDYNKLVNILTLSDAEIDSRGEDDNRDDLDFLDVLEKKYAGKLGDVIERGGDLTMYKTFKDNEEELREKVLLMNKNTIHINPNYEKVEDKEIDDILGNLDKGKPPPGLLGRSKPTPIKTDDYTPMDPDEWLGYTNDIIPDPPKIIEPESVLDKKPIKSLTTEEINDEKKKIDKKLVGTAEDLLILDALNKEVLIRSDKEGYIDKSMNKIVQLWNEYFKPHINMGNAVGVAGALFNQYTLGYLDIASTLMGKAQEYIPKKYRDKTLELFLGNQEYTTWLLDEFKTQKQIMELNKEQLSFLQQQRDRIYEFYLLNVNRVRGGQTKEIRDANKNFKILTGMDLSEYQRKTEALGDIHINKGTLGNAKTKYLSSKDAIKDLNSKFVGGVVKGTQRNYAGNPIKNIGRIKLNYKLDKIRERLNQRGTNRIDGRTPHGRAERERLEDQARAISDELVRIAGGTIGIQATNDITAPRVMANQIENYLRDQERYAIEGRDHLLGWSRSQLIRDIGFHLNDASLYYSGFYQGKYIYHTSSIAMMEVYNNIGKTPMVLFGYPVGIIPVEQERRNELANLGKLTPLERLNLRIFNPKYIEHRIKFVKDAEDRKNEKRYYKERADERNIKISKLGLLSKLELKVFNEDDVLERAKQDVDERFALSEVLKIKTGLLNKIKYTTLYRPEQIINRYKKEKEWKQTTDEWDEINKWDKIYKDKMKFEPRTVYQTLATGIKDEETENFRQIKGKEMTSYEWLLGDDELERLKKSKILIKNKTQRIRNKERQQYYDNKVKLKSGFVRVNGMF